MPLEWHYLKTVFSDETPQLKLSYAFPALDATLRKTKQRNNKKKKNQPYKLCQGALHATTHSFQNTAVNLPLTSMSNLYDSKQFLDCL